MATIDYRQIVLEQREEILLDRDADYVQREKIKGINPKSSLAQIITGVRRCGKSTLARMALSGLTYAYINFDDERLTDIGATELNNILEAVYAVYGDFTHLLLDEIQNVEGWHLFVNRLLRNNFKIILTGSNSKLLSREMASHLTGRYIPIELFSFSFTEYLQAKKIHINNPFTAKGRGLATNYFMKYLHSGGFPEIIHNEENKQTYIRNLFEAIVTRDIIYRYNIRHIRTFREIAVWLTAHFSTEVSYNRIKNIFELGSENTAKNYVTYLEEAWLFISLSKFSFKKQESLRNRKIYLVDTAFAELSGESATENTGRLLENIVLLHLFRNRFQGGYEVYYYKKNVEVDFVVYSKRSVNELIQVSLSLGNEKTREREIRSLVRASGELHPKNVTIITLNQKEDIVVEGIQISIKPVTEWIFEQING
jgi:predicted AAA+ superfamily ATPase